MSVAMDKFKKSHNLVIIRKLVQQYIIDKSARTLVLAFILNWPYSAQSILSKNYH